METGVVFVSRGARREKEGERMHVSGETEVWSFSFGVTFPILSVTSMTDRGSLIACVCGCSMFERENARFT